MSDLPVNVDSTYADDGGDPSVKAHQQHHDALHAFYNAWREGPELGYAEALTDFATASTTFVDVTGLDVDVVVGDYPVSVEFDCLGVASSVADGRVAIAILEDSTVIAQAWVAGSGVAGRPVLLNRKVRRLPSAGSHNYKVQLRAVDAATVTLYAEAAILNGGPMFLRVVQL